MTVLDGGSLREQRLALGFSQANLAAALGVSANTVARWERGELRIGRPARVAEAIARLKQQQRSDGAGLVSRSMRHNLPADLNSFVGREHELAALMVALDRTRLLTLVGPGGVGKTRLGMRVAQSTLDGFSGGVWLVELASVADPALVPHAVASALRLRDVPGESLTVTLTERIVEQQALLVLDNCEHLVHACAELVHALLSGCPGLRVVATSRQPLGVAGETAWHVPPLAMADAVHLFVERARAARPNFEVPPLLEPMLADICQRLDGMPLAIELAAVRARALGLEQIAGRLGDRSSCFRAAASLVLPATGVCVQRWSGATSCLTARNGPCSAGYQYLRAVGRWTRLRKSAASLLAQC